VRLLWRLLAANRDYRLTVLAALISLGGDWALRVGLAYHVYLLTGSTVASGLLLASSLVPQLLLGSIAGVFVDRWDRRRTMVATNLALAAGLLPLLAVRSASEVWIIYAVAFAESMLAQFFVPAEAAIVPLLVSPESLITANAVNSQARDVSRLVGSAAGGILAGSTGLAGLVGLDIATYLVAAALLTGISWRPTILGSSAGPDGTAGPLSVAESLSVAGPLSVAESLSAAGSLSVAGPLSGATDEALPPGPSALVAVAREWREGITLATRSAVLRVLLVFTAVTSIGEGAVGALFAPFVRSTLHGSAGAYGVIVAAQAAGGIGGGLVAASIAHRFRIGPLFVTAAVSFGALDAALFCYPFLSRALWPAVVLMLLVGLPAALIVAALMSLFQSAVGDRHRGRIFGTVGAIEGAGMLIGALCAGWLASRVGIVPVISFQAAAYVLSGLAVRRPLREATQLVVPAGKSAAGSAPSC
jgi:MFS family permease